jgi:hypothetical protein
VNEIVNLRVSQCDGSPAEEGLGDNLLAPSCPEIAAAVLTVVNRGGSAFFVLSLKTQRGSQRHASAPPQG